MKAKHKRLLIIITAIFCMGGALAFMLKNFQDNLLFFYTPTELMERQVTQGQSLRLGGLVADGSFQQNGNDIVFVITDGENEITVNYNGMLPSLFREGQGMVALGSLNKDGVFAAESLLARHDENYMPPEVAKKLGQYHR